MKTPPATTVICMGGHQARDRELERQLARLDLAPRWLEAVEGRKLPPLGPWTVADLTAQAWFNWVDPYSGRTLTLGEVGCTLSHVLCWQQAAQADHPTLILEEDARLRDGCEGWLPAVLDDLEMLPHWDLCYLSQRNPLAQVGALVGRYIHRVSYQPIWTLAYLVSPQGAQRLLASPWNQYLVPSDDLIPACFGIHGQELLNHHYNKTQGTMVAASHQNVFVPRENAFAQSQTERSIPVHYPDNGLVAFTVATEDRPELRRLQKTAARYAVNLTVLGMGQPWRGGDMARQAGGGQKVNLLRPALEDLAEDQIVLFMDGYDVVVTGHVRRILASYEQLGTAVVFAAEPFCWPDRELADRYPETDSPWRFLNSGCFIGRAGALRQLLSKPIADADDDQLYYTRQFLSGEHDIVLDTGCLIFQCLNGSLDSMEVDRARGALYNRHHKSWPAVVHANGPVGEWLEKEGAPVGGRSRGVYGKMD